MSKTIEKAKIYDAIEVVSKRADYLGYCREGKALIKEFKVELGLEEDKLPVYEKILVSGEPIWFGNDNKREWRVAYIEELTQSIRLSLSNSTQVYVIHAWREDQKTSLQINAAIAGQLTVNRKIVDDKPVIADGVLYKWADRNNSSVYFSSLKGA